MHRAAGREGDVGWGGKGLADLDGKVCCRHAGGASSGGDPSTGLDRSSYSLLFVLSSFQ